MVKGVRGKGSDVVQLPEPQRKGFLHTTCSICILFIGKGLDG
jgi:hypothetical protein